MRRTLAVFTVGLLAFGVMATVSVASAEPSSYCNGGQVPPSTTPAGIGVLAVGDPTTGVSLVVCNTGAVVPAPGAAAVNLSATGQLAEAAVDGDSTNTLTPCTDGWMWVHADGGPNVEARSSADGDNVGQTQPMSPDAFVLSLLLCAPAAPSVPAPGLPV